MDFGPWHTEPGSPVYRANVTATVELRADVIKPRSDHRVREELLRCLHQLNFEVEYGPGDYDVMEVHVGNITETETGA